MRVEILGTGCAKCSALESNARAAAAKGGIECEIVKITDVREIAARGVMRTPALLIAGKVVSSGKIPEPDQIVEFLKEATP